MDYKLRCNRCSRYSKDYTLFRCRSCSSVLEVVFDYSTLRLPKNFKRERPRNRKYLPFLPIESMAASLNEGGTPLVRRVIRGYEDVNTFFKLEEKNPTRSFKDRGSAVEITKALEFGYDKVVCASTGNMGMSIAHYASEVGIKSTIFISGNANVEKIAKIRGYGGRVAKVGGDFNKAMRGAELFSVSESAFLCGDYHFRKEGQKTVIYEIIEQMRYNVPDVIFVPVGNATLLSAMGKGLNEYRAIGFIDRLPKIVAVQSGGCDPLVKAFNRKEKIAYVKPNTVADAIAVGYPTFGPEGIETLKETRGRAIKVPDSDIIKAVRKLGRNGMRAETGGATGFAGFAEMYKYERRALAGKNVVVVVTGNNEPKR